jgi:hypothetical protein
MGYFYAMGIIRDSDNGLEKVFAGSDSKRCLDFRGMIPFAGFDFESIILTFKDRLFYGRFA